MDFIDISCNLIIYFLLLIIVILYFVYKSKKYVMESFKIRKRPNSYRPKIARPKTSNKLKMINKDVQQIKINANENNSCDIANRNLIAHKNKCARQLKNSQNKCVREVTAIKKKNNRELEKNKKKFKSVISKIRNKSKKLLDTKDNELHSLQNIVDSLEQSLVNEKIKSSNLELELQNNNVQLDRLKHNSIQLRSGTISNK